MFNKIYAFLKDNRKEIIIFVLLLVIFNIRFPYYIDSPGGTISLKDRIKIEDASINGDISLVYVSERPATIPTLTLAFLLKDWDILKQEEVLYSNENDEDMEKRGKITYNQGFNNALVYAFQKAGKDINILSTKLYITYVAEEADTDLKIGDQILYINDSKIENKDDISKQLESIELGEEILVKVLSNGKEVTRKAKIIDIEGVKKVGIIVETIYDYETSIKVSHEEKSGEMGSSGGFANTLYIYSLLVDEDIIKNRKIVATGTIDNEGNVGMIGGVKYKIKAAVKTNSDVFFVPNSNCTEAKKIKDENNYSLNVVCINNFDDAIEYLKK